MQSILTTENVPPRRRAEYWEQMVSQEFVPARCVPAARSLFDARIRSLDLDALTLCDVRSHGTDVLRTPGHISKADTPYFLVSLQMEGIGQLVQAGRSVILHPGDMALYDTSRAYELHFGGAQRQLVLRIPRADLIARGPNVESLVGIGIPNAAPAARLAADMTRNLAALDALPSPRARHSLASTLIDLVLDGLLALDGGQSTQTGSARLADAQRIALKHLADPAFSVAKWAHTMGISERYLRLLFAPSSRSPAQYLWGQRLDRAASELRAPGSRGRSITDIALGCGFNDSAHFSHAFRAAFGMSPRDYRASN